MQNEKQVSSKSNRLRGVRIFWYRSLFLLVFPSFQGDLATEPEPRIEPIMPSATVLPFAHAHNDYQHDKPLAEALSRGFVSVEADVHLVGNELYLGHWFPKLSPESTLRERYLKPLNDLMMRQNGKVYTNYSGVFYLMIDIKTDSLSTWRALRNALLDYPVFQCNPHFQVFISGNRALFHAQQDEEQVMTVDGRLPDLFKQTDSGYMPVISDNFRKYFKWRGRGPIPEEEFSLLLQLSGEAHRQGKKLRFWSIPDLPDAWKVLMKAGVDLISTDNLQGLEQFCISGQMTD